MKKSRFQAEKAQNRDFFFIFFEKTIAGSKKMRTFVLG